MCGVVALHVLKNSDRIAFISLSLIVVEMIALLTTLKHPSAFSILSWSDGVTRTPTRFNLAEIEGFA